MRVGGPPPRLGALLAGALSLTAAAANIRTSGAGDTPTRDRLPNRGDFEPDSLAPNSRQSIGASASAPKNPMQVRSRQHKHERDNERFLLLGRSPASYSSLVQQTTTTMGNELVQADRDQLAPIEPIGSPRPSFQNLLNETMANELTALESENANTNHYENEQLEQLDDWWSQFWSSKPFPSGYTQSSIIMLACFIGVIILLIVIGNLLVCIAIFTEKSLKPTQNWFIASLAVSDMLLGLVVMPFSLARELMGFWMFGPIWCDMHEALDVLLTTASINTLCLISLDRYWSITQAVSYLKKRTPRRGAFMIAFVWFFSAAVSLPPLFGWKKQTASIIMPNTNPPPQNLTNAASSSSSHRPATGASGTNSNKSTSPPSHAPHEQTTRAVKKRRATIDQLHSAANRDRMRPPFDTNHGPRPFTERDQLSTPLLSPAPRGRDLLMAATSPRLDSFALAPDQVSSLVRVSMMQQTTSDQILLLDPSDTPPGAGPDAGLAQTTTEYPSCQLSDDIGYVLYSALGSFFLPCAVMVFTYIKIFLAARSRARRTIVAKPSRTNKEAGQRRQLQLQQHLHSSVSGSGQSQAQSPNWAHQPSTASQRKSGNLMMIQQANHQTKHNKKSNEAQFRRDQEAELGVQPPKIKGKIVIVERKKSLAASSLAPLEPDSVPGEANNQKGQDRASSGPNDQLKRKLNRLSTSHEAGEPGEEVDEEARAASCTLITSVAQLASPSALSSSEADLHDNSAGNNANTANTPDQIITINDNDNKKNGLDSSQANTATTLTNASQHSDSGSSIVTVMKPSMVQVPVTRFNFQTNETEVIASKSRLEEEKRKAAALLAAFTSIGSSVPASSGRARHANEPTSNTSSESSDHGTSLIMREILSQGSSHEDKEVDRDSKDSVLMADATSREEFDKEKHDEPIGPSTKETCFMTMDEDSEMIDSQAGRTILMVASRLRHAGASTCGSNRAARNSCTRHEHHHLRSAAPEAEDDGLTMTMMPGPQAAAKLCSNSACQALINRANQIPSHNQNSSAAATRSGSSFGGSMSSIIVANQHDQHHGQCPLNSNHINNNDESPCHVHHAAKKRLQDQDPESGQELESNDDLLYEEEEGFMSECNGFSVICGLEDEDETDFCSRCHECEHDGSSTNSMQLGRNESTSFTDSPRAAQQHQRFARAPDCERAQPPLDLETGGRRPEEAELDVEQRVGGEVGFEIEAEENEDDNDELDEELEEFELEDEEESSSVLGHDLLNATPQRRKQSISGSNRKPQSASDVSQRKRSIIGIRFPGLGSSTLHNQEQAQNIGLKAPENKVTGGAQKPTRSIDRGQAQPPSSSESRAATIACHDASEPAAHSSQQKAIVTSSGGGSSSRNLKALRQNFFLKLNQLTAKSSSSNSNQQQQKAKDRKLLSGSGRKNSNSDNKPSLALSYEPSTSINAIEYPMETTIGDDSAQNSGHTIDLEPSNQTHALNSTSDQTTTTNTGDQIKPNNGSKPEMATLRNGRANQHSFNNNNNKQSIRSRAHNGTPKSTLISSSSAEKSLVQFGDEMMSVVCLQNQGATGKSAKIQDPNSTGPARPSSKSANSNNQLANSSGGGPLGQAKRAHLPADTERHKRKLAKARERRATLILGLIMATFITSWLPFFSFYVLRALCTVCRDFVSPRFEAFIFWMGYCNSAINPIIYTIFNRDFRKAFRNILFRCL